MNIDLNVPEVSLFKKLRTGYDVILIELNSMIEHTQTFRETDIATRETTAILLDRLLRQRAIIDIMIDQLNQWINIGKNI